MFPWDTGRGMPAHMGASHEVVVARRDVRVHRPAPPPPLDPDTPIPDDPAPLLPSTPDLPPAPHEPSPYTEPAPIEPEPEPEPV